MKKNIILQTLYQLLAVIVPFVTTPYLSRTLGAENIGIYSYTYSYIYYFTMIAMLGFSSYGSKEIASIQTNTQERNTKFWSIYLAQICMVTVSMILFLIYLAVLCVTEIKMVMALQGIYLVACFFDVNWYYFGIERFSVTVTRNIIVKIISVVLIFYKVKNQDDLLPYIAIMAGTQLINNLIVFGLVIKREKFNYPKKSDVLTHLKESFILFIPVTAMSIYHLMDKTMLGILSDNLNSGYYYNTDKVINIPLCAIIGVGTVMLPRLSAIISSGNVQESDKIFKKSYEAYICLCCAMAFGIAAISPEFVPLFFGEGYEPCIILISVMAIALPFKALSDMYKTQFFIPQKRNKFYICSVSFGACINLALNYSLIKSFNLGAMGATVATVFTEGIVCIIQSIYIFREIKMSFCEIARPFIYICFGAIMYFLVRKASMISDVMFIAISVKILVGVLIYGFCCLIFWSVLSKNNSKPQ